MGERPRELVTILGVDEDSGAFVLVAGIVLILLTVCACCYCKLYDPIKKCTIKCCERCKRQKATAEAAEQKRRVSSEVSVCGLMRLTCPLRPTVAHARSGLVVHEERGLLGGTDEFTGRSPLSY